MRARGWAGIGLAILFCAGFLKFCVRIVPADAPVPMLPSRPAAADAGPLLIPVAAVPPTAISATLAQARASGARPPDALAIMAARGRAVRWGACGRTAKE